MNRILNLAGLFALANFGVESLAAAPPVRILPLGDSITQGCCSESSSEGGYRNRLFALLTAEGFDVDFVGTLADAANPALPDTQHQGMAGYQIAKIRSVLGISLKAIADPDVVLLHAGTNDITAGATVAVVQDRLRGLIADISTLRPHAKILLASPILRTDSSSLELKHAALAASLPQLAGEQAALGRKVHYVDLHSALDPADLNDGVHPTDAGYDKMADAWLPAITAVTGPYGDAEPPVIAGASSMVDLQSVAVKFSKPVNPATVLASNFSIDGGVSVLDAQLDAASQRIVTLSTGLQESGKPYVVTVSGVRDQTTQQALILANSTRAFTAYSVIDGSFEADGIGWTKTDVLVADGSSVVASEGVKTVVFNGSDSDPGGVVSQGLSTLPGQKYRLEFDMGVLDFGNQVQRLELTVTGNSVLVNQVEVITGEGGGSTSWTPRTVEFVADSLNTTVEFRDVSLVTTNVDLLLDDVRMNAETTPTLTVTSSPGTGASVTVSPADNGSNSDGTTEFTRVYNEGVTVNLTAPATLSGKTFDKWQQDGVNHSTAAATTVTMDANHTMSAVYKLLVNGSFELGSPGDAGTLDGWTVTGSTGEPPFQPFGYLSHTGYVPSEGLRQAVFSGGSNVFDGAISQDFATAIGQSYTLTFDLGIYGSTGLKQRVRVDVDGASSLVSQLETVTSTGIPTPWVAKSIPFVADSTTTTLTFTDVSGTVSPNANADLRLDNVQVAETVVNAVPVANDDSYSATQDVVLAVPAPGVLGNDSDGDLDPLTAVVDSNPSNGVLALAADGSFTYTPNGGYTGPDSFTYHANDGAADSNVATVSITVSTAPLTLVANGSFETGVVTTESVPASPGSPGSVTALDDWTVTGPPFGYIADANYTATDGSRLCVFNGGGTAFGGTVSQVLTTTPGTTYELTFDAGVFGASGKKQRIQASVDGGSNLLSETFDVTSTGGSTWVPRSHIFVADGASATLTFTDLSAGLSGTSTSNSDLLLDSVSVSISTGNAAPVANDDSYSTQQDVDLVVAAAGVLSNDTDGDSDPLTAVVDASPSNGGLTLNADGSFTYSPNGGYTGPDSFTYHANDGTVDSNVATVSINVTAPSVNLALNGSFETGDATGAPITVLDDWTVAGSTIGYIADANYTATEGARIAAFNGGSNTFDGSISQSFATTPGEYYTLDLDMGIFATVAGRKQRLLVTVDGAATLVSQVEESTATTGPAQWVTRSYGFVADSATTTLTLADASGTLASGNTNSDLLVDNVRILLQPSHTLTVAGAPSSGASITVSPADLVGDADGTTNFTRTYADGASVTLTAPASFGGGPFVKWQKDGVDFSVSTAASVTLTADTTMTAFFDIVDPPEAVADAYSTDEDVLLSVAAPGVLGNDSDPNSTPFTAVLDTDVANGTLMLSSDGSFTYTPADDFNGADSFTYHAFNGTSSSGQVTVSLTVDPINDEPVADAQPVTVNEDDSVAITLTGSDVDGDELSFAVVTGPANGSLGGTAPELTYTPDPDYSGADSFTFTVNDGLVDSAAATVSITVDPLADPPVAVADIYATAVDANLVIAAPGVLANDSDPDGDALTAVLDTDAVNGTLSLNSDGGFSYQPDPGYTGADSFSYVANDGATDSNIVVVTLNIGAGGNLVANGSFETGAVTTEAVPETPGSPGSVTALDDWSVAGGPFGYIATTTYTATDGVRIAVFNGGGNVYGGTVSQTIATVPGNTYELRYDAGIYGTAGKKQRLAVTVDGTSQVLAETDDLIAVAGPAQWTTKTYTFVADSAASTLTFTDNSASFGGTIASGCDLLVDRVSVSLSVANTAPVAVDDTYSTDVDVNLVVAADGVLANDSDVDSDPLTAVVETNPANGSLTLNSDGGFTYSPNPGYAGPDSFTYRANDGEDNSNIATVSIAVAAPVVELVANGSFEIGAVLTEVDPDPEPGTPGSPGSVTALDDWTVTGSPFGYAATTNYTATDGLRIALFNGGSESFGGTISQVLATTPGSTYELTFDVGIFGASGRKQRLLVTADGTVQVLAQIVNLTATSGPAQWSPQSFVFVADSATTTLTFTDNSGAITGGQAAGCDMLLDHVGVVLSAGNQAPIANDDSYATPEDTQLVVAAPGVLVNDTDAESDPITASLVAGAANGTVSLSPDGSFIYDPDPGYNGADSFTYRANDGSLDSSIATVSITVGTGPVVPLANGSFELGAVVSGQVTALDDWTVAGSPFGYIADASYTSTDGLRIAVFNGGGDSFGGTISQTFGTVSGETYLVEFDTGIVGASGKKQRLQVAVDGGASLLSETINLTSAGGVANWSARNFTFVADGASATITFTDLSGTLGGSFTSVSDLLVDHVRIGVSTANTAPLASNDAYSVVQDQLLTIVAPGVLDNDSDGESDPLTAVLVAGPTNGSLNLASDGSFTYEPAPGYTGLDSFTYMANDGLLDSTVATVSLTVSAPTVNELANGSFEIGAVLTEVDPDPEPGTPGSPGSVTELEDWSVSGNPFGYAASTPYTSTEGARIAVFNGGNNIFNGVISQNFVTVPGQAYSLDLDLGVVGTSGRKQRLAISVDGTGNLLAEVREVTAAAGAARWTSQNFAFIANSATTTLTLSDNSGTLSPTVSNACDLLLDNVSVTELQDARALTVNSSPVSGLDVTVSPADLAGDADAPTDFTRTYANGVSVTLTATAASGPNVFEKWQQDGSDLSSNLSVTITMDADHTMTAVYLVDNSPRATDDTYSVDEDAQLVVAAPGVLDNDIDPNALSVTAVLETTTANGTLALNADGSFTYDPDEDFNGSDSFTYHVDNGSLESGVATVIITVDPVNDDPIADAQSVETDEDVPLAITLAGSDPEGDSLAYTIVDAPANGELSGIIPDLTYTPDENYFGPDSFTFLVNDGTADSVLATVSINVVSQEDVPVGDDQSLAMVAATSLPVVLTGNDGDGDPITFALVGAPTNGVLTGTAPNVTYTPAQDFTGTDSFTFTVNDGDEDSAPATITISVGEVLLNGSFELVTGGAPDFWVSTGNYGVEDSDTEDPIRRTATDGVKLVAFNKNNLPADAVISQTFSTTPGQPYALTFDRGVQAFNSSEQRLEVKLEGSETLVSNVESVFGTNNSGFSVWVPRSYTFIADSPTTTLTFTDKSPTSFLIDVLLDKVKITPIVTRTIDVASSPDPGVSVTVSAPDIYGDTDGVTDFSRVYYDNESVNLTAPAAIGAMNFEKWLKDGADYGVTPSITVVADAGQALIAVYIPNEAPVVAADAYSTDEDVELLVAAPGVLGNDSDPEFQTLTATVVDGVAHGTLLLNSDGGFSYSPIKTSSVVIRLLTKRATEWWNRIR